MGLWDYAGKRVAIVGCASGMGEATARELVALGAEVHGADIRPSPAPLASFRTIDLKDPASIDAALDSIGGKLDGLFNCAGLPQPFPPIDVMKVNFIGTRYLTERAVGMIKPGGAIASIASTAGFAYMQNLEPIKELLAIPDFASASQWCEERLELVGDGYTFSKQVLIVWTMVMGARLIKQGVRINCICPGPTQTPMMSSFESHAGAAVIDVFTEPMGRRSTPEEQARPLIFLNSDAASYINGHPLNVDGGCIGAVTTGELDLRALMGAAMGAAST